MADLNESWKLGEYRGENIFTEVVQYGDTIVAGDVVTITGRNSDGQLIVSKQTAKTRPYGICPIKSDGVAGDVREILTRGPIKVTFGSAAATGLPLGVTASKFVAVVAASSSAVAINMTSTAANNDTGIVYFDFTGVVA